MGEEGFRWFIARVVNILDDEKQLGRVKIRVLNDHDDPNISDDDLLWAVPLQPITSSAYAQIGTSPTGVQVGATVFGFFLDGQEKQIPMILGTYAKITNGVDDLPPLALGKNPLKVDQVGPEPAPAYAGKYPYNTATQTPSGHAIEIDDTPNNERLHVYHKAGTYVEVNHDGRLVVKSVDDAFEIVVKNKTVYVKGNLNVQIVGNATVEIDGNADVSVQGNVGAKVGGTLNASVGGSADITVGGSTQVNSGGQLSISAPSTSLSTSEFDITGHVTINGNLDVTGPITSEGQPVEIGFD